MVQISKDGSIDPGPGDSTSDNSLPGWIQCDGCQDAGCLKSARLKDVMHDQIENKHVLSFFQKHDLIPASRACNKCKRECVFKEGNKKRPKWKHWKCTKCNNEFGAQGRFFEHYDKLLIVVAIIYMLMHDYPIRLIKHELNVKGRGKNVHDMIYNLGKVASKFLKDKFRRECGTWGANPDEHVQIDEAAVGNRKYQRGVRNRRGGVLWFMSMVLVRGGKVVSYFFEEIPTGKRTWDQLTWHIRRLAARGATVVSDCHKSYQRLGKTIRRCA